MRVKKNKSMEYHNDEKLIKSLRSSPLRIELISGVSEKGIRKDPIELYLDPTLVSLREKRKI